MVQCILCRTCPCRRVYKLGPFFWSPPAQAWQAGSFVGELKLRFHTCVGVLRYTHRSQDSVDHAGTYVMNPCREGDGCAAGREDTGSQCSLPPYFNSWIGLTPAARVRSRLPTAASAVLALSDSLATRSCTAAASSKRPWHTACEGVVCHHFALRMHDIFCSALNNNLQAFLN